MTDRQTLRQTDTVTDMMRPREACASKNNNNIENSIKLGGWGQHRTYILLFFLFFIKKHLLKSLDIALKEF